MTGTPLSPVTADTDLQAMRVATGQAIAAALRVEADLARESPRGRHPAIPSVTHAAALLFAADVAEAIAQGSS